MSRFRIFIKRDGKIFNTSARSPWHPLVPLQREYRSTPIRGSLPKDGIAGPISPPFP